MRKNLTTVSKYTSRYPITIEPIIQNEAVRLGG